MIKAVFYDLDGVLADACEIHYQALNKALESTINYTISRADHITIYNGLPTRKKLLLLQAQYPDIDIEQINALKQQYTIEEIQKLTTDFEKRNMLQFVKDKFGVLNVCVTNSVRLTASLMTENLGFEPYLDGLITNEDIKNPKPSPDGYLAAKKWLEEELGYPKMEWNEILILEDSPVGLQAAEATDPNVRIITVNNINDLNTNTLTNAITYLNTL
jgi:beta-phosphoglucomutase-like phosphatase (HAD superfamily)